MGSENSQRQINSDMESNNVSATYLQNFRLYETRANFYIIGRDKSRAFWKVLKIDRTEPSELTIVEDSTTYSESECSELLNRINEGNKSTGGLKFVTTCYGIVGFVKFLGPYYMVLITQRKKIGTICGHAIYAITKSEMIPLPNSTPQSNSKNENRYKKLLRAVDLTKDFFFSYSYHVMLSLQKNLSNHDSRPPVYETLFVWNEYLTRGIRNQLKHTMWTVALVYGFFNQIKLTVSGKKFNLTLIARRSRHYAGTRFLKRGVNVKGRVANDVETEQIICDDVTEGCPAQISSVVQIRGSIPLYWSQETSRLNIKPDIILSTKDHNYAATRLHFENLVKRYGNPVIILNLIKAREKKPRESILLAEFAHAIEVINRDLTEEDRLKFLHWDMSKYSKNKNTNVLGSLSKMASNILDMTGFFYCHLIPCSRTEEWLNQSYYDNKDGDDSAKELPDKDSDNLQISPNEAQLDNTHIGKPLNFQKGVLRTNCIDCLDRTNVAQYAYGLIALGHQLHALKLISVPKVDLDSPLANELMRIYEVMGDTLAFQYGGSAAHNKIFCQRRGQPKAVTQSQEFFRSLQRYYSNAYMDPEKQDAINVFLGYFQPQQGKPALWELDSDQHYNIGRRVVDYYMDDCSRFSMKRSMSDGNIKSDPDIPIGETSTKENEESQQQFIESLQSGGKGLSDSSPDISTCETDVSKSRYTPSMPRTHLFVDSIENDGGGFHENRTTFNSTNFFHDDWLSSSANSCDEESYERSALIGTSSNGQSSNSIAEGIKVETSSSASSVGKAREAQNSKIVDEYSDDFVKWVTSGGLLFPWY